MTAITWKTSDVRRLMDSALDGFANEFYGKDYRTLDRTTKRSLLKAFRADIDERHSYEWIMRGVK